MIPPFLKNFSLSTILGLAVGILLAGYAVFAFNPPTQAPPAGNVGAPINTGSVPQVKSGGLSVGSLLVGGGLKLGNYTTKPVCDASLTGNLIFDTSANKPYVCSSGGAWKPLDSYAYGQSTYYSYGQSAYAPAKSCFPGNCWSGIQYYPLSSLQSACNTYCGATGTVTCILVAGKCSSGPVDVPVGQSGCGGLSYSTCTNSGSAGGATGGQPAGVPSCNIPGNDPYSASCGTKCTC